MIILDTNVLSEVIRRAPDESVLAWLDAQQATDVATTAITAAELLYGVARLPDGRRKTALAGAINALLHNDFRDRIESFDTRASEEYASIVSVREKLGCPITTADAQIAAICRSRQAVLATRNVKDFEDTGIELVYPWYST